MGACIVSEASKSETTSPNPAARRWSVRVLCLGNDLIGDDSVGGIVAAHVRQFAPADVEVVGTPETGFHLLDYVLNTTRVIVVDTVVTGSAPPGTIYEFRDTDLKSVPGVSPHYVGLFEALAVARHLRLPAAEQALILAVEAADCSTIGEAMHPAVVAAIPALIKKVRERIGGDAGGGIAPGKGERGTNRGISGA
jgi:hydrogenase maturation protease